MFLFTSLKNHNQKFRNLKTSFQREESEEQNDYDNNLKSACYSQILDYFIMYNVFVFGCFQTQLYQIINK